MKVPLVSAHVCFSVPLCKHSLAACVDESHACPRPPTSVRLPVYGLETILAHGHHRLAVTDRDKGLVDQALYSQSTQSVQGQDLPVRGAKQTSHS